MTHKTVRGALSHLLETNIYELAMPDEVLDQALKELKELMMEVLKDEDVNVPANTMALAIIRNQLRSEQRETIENIFK